MDLILDDIEELEARKDVIGTRILALKQMYIEKNCPFEVGERVYYTANVKRSCGVICRIYLHDTDPVIYKYHIEPRNKGWVKPPVMRAYHVVGEDRVEKTPTT